MWDVPIHLTKSGGPDGVKALGYTIFNHTNFEGGHGCNNHL